MKALLVLVFLTGCGAHQRESTIKAALVTVDASRETFLAYDATEQADIVAHATSPEAGRAELTKYRDKRGTVEKTLEGAYRAIALAATLNDDHSMNGLTAAVLQVVEAVGSLTGGKK